VPIAFHRSRRALASLLASVLLLAACGSDDSETAEPTTTTTSSTTTTTEPTTTTTTLPDDGRSYVATAKRGSIDVYAQPRRGEPDRTITEADATSVPGATPIVFLVRQARDNWFQVYLPVRPNGSRGWVRARDVTVSRHDFRIEVELGDKRLRVYEGDDVVVDEAIGVGRKDRPTPGGVYYIKELLQPPDPDGVYGSFAYGLSGFSTVLESFNGGEGVIGIHGTNDPDSIGRSVSSGCIRLTNEVIERMVNDIGLPLGTPVDIQA
jgi:lipoprotein-anchoring transpeptidase ErfK/SrfK